MKTKTYLVLYYIIFILTILSFLFTSIKTDKLVTIGDTGLYINSLQSYLLIINVLLGIVFTIFLIIKRKITYKSIIFPISYIIFFCFVIGLCFLMNNKTLVSYMQFIYYFNFIMIYFTFFNIYSLLCIDFKHKRDKK